MHEIFQYVVCASNKMDPYPYREDISVYMGYSRDAAFRAMWRALDRAAVVTLWDDGSSVMWGRRDEYGEPVLMPVALCWHELCGQIPSSECRCDWADANPPK